MIKWARNFNRNWIHDDHKQKLFLICFLFITLRLLVLFTESSELLFATKGSIYGTTSRMLFVIIDRTWLPFLNVFFPSFCLCIGTVNLRPISLHWKIFSIPLTECNLRSSPSKKSMAYPPVKFDSEWPISNKKSP